MVIIPASATVFVQAVEIRTTEVCGFDMSGVNLHRWHPAYLCGQLPPSSQILFSPILKR